MGKQQEVTLDVTQVMTDGQDGGYSLSFYKDEETAKRTIANAHDKEFDDLDWDDEYEYGYFSHRSLRFNLNEDGTLSLLGDSMYVGHFGQ